MFRQKFSLISGSFFYPLKLENLPQNGIETRLITIAHSSSIGIAYKSKIKKPFGKSLVSWNVIVGSSNVDLTQADYSTDKILVNVGLSKDGYIQYSIIEENNHRANSHSLYLVFM